MVNRFSYSSLDSYLQCPRKFRFRYIEKPKLPDIVPAQTYLGTAVHRVLHDLHTHGNDGVLIPLEDALKIYHAEWEKVDPKLFAVTSAHYSVDDYIRIGREMLTTYYNRYQPFSEGTLLGAEMMLQFTLPGTKAKFQARVDRLWKRDDGVIEICDFKTGSRMSRPRDKSFYYQMGGYELAVRDSFPQYEQIELAQYFLRQDEVVRLTLSSDDLDQIATEFRQAIGEISHAFRLDDFPTRESGLCNWCEYIELCPAKRHKQLLEESEDAEESGLSVAQRGEELAAELLTAYLVQKEKIGEYEQLKAKAAEFVRLHPEFEKLSSKFGDVSVKISTNEKFVTQSDDRESFVKLSALADRLGLHSYFKLNTLALMKEIFKKNALSEEQLAQLEEFVVRQESVRVTARPKKDVDPNDE
jgi:RecB family exonuclease